MPQEGIVQRAFELAQSGEYRSITDVKRRLKAEGFDNIEAYFAGRAIKKQLMDLLEANRPSDWAELL